MAKDKLQIVFASAEAAPFVKTGGLGDVAGSLPQALVQAGAEVIVMVPKYATIGDEFKQQMRHMGEFYVSLGWRNEWCGMDALDYNGVTYIFLDNEHYFGRSYPYGFFDDGERFAFFSKAITESLQHLPEGFQCDILHCNDWHTALAPVFLREFYQGLPLYENVRTVFTIHNIAFQGQFSDKMLNDVLGLAHIPNAARQLRYDDSSINFMQGALDYSDYITTVSPTYASEIQTSDFGEGLDGILRNRNYILRGILNGIDQPSWDPSTDIQIPAHYSKDNMAGKLECKHALQRELGLEVRDDRPLMVMVSRLTRQKGLDLVTYSLDRILSGGVQVAVLGTGDRAYEDAMNYFQAKYPGTMAARITFDSALSRRMYAGADMFLMPSLFEPCGLSQIIAMRYGTLPIVRETGGLRDTVTPYNYYTGEGTGFSFANFNGDEMGDAVFRAARLYWDDRDAFNNVVRQAMEKDFSWKRSAVEYMDLYHGLHPEIEIHPFENETPAPKPEPKATPEVVPEKAPEPEAKAVIAPEVKPQAEPTKPQTEVTKEVKIEAAKPAAEPKAEVKPEPKAEPAAKVASKTTTKKTAAKTTAKKTSAAKSTTTTKKTTTKTAAAKTATKTSPTKTTAKATATKAATVKATPKVAQDETPKVADTSKPSAPKVAAKSPAAPKTPTKSVAPKTATKSTVAPKTAAKPAAPKVVASKTSTEAKPAEAAKPTAATAKPVTPSKPSAPSAKPAAAPKAPTEPSTKATATAKPESKTAPRTKSSARVPSARKRR